MEKLKDILKEEEERQRHPFRTEIAIDEMCAFYREQGYIPDADFLEDENPDKDYEPYPTQRKIKINDAEIEASDFYRFCL